MEVVEGIKELDVVKRAEELDELEVTIEVEVEVEVKEVASTGAELKLVDADDEDTAPARLELDEDSTTSEDSADELDADAKLDADAVLSDARVVLDDAAEDDIDSSRLEEVDNELSGEVELDVSMLVSEATELVIVATPEEDVEAPDDSDDAMDETELIELLRSLMIEDGVSSGAVSNEETDEDETESRTLEGTDDEFSVGNELDSSEVEVGSGKAVLMASLIEDVDTLGGFNVSVGDDRTSELDDVIVSKEDRDSGAEEAEMSSETSAIEEALEIGEVWLDGKGAESELAGLLIESIGSDETVSTSLLAGSVDVRSGTPLLFSLVGRSSPEVVLPSSGPGVDSVSSSSSEP